MLEDLKKYLVRLKNPSTVMGITGYVLCILITSNIDVDTEAVITIVQSICGIFVLLGIMNNPTTNGVDLPFKESTINKLKHKEKKNDKKSV